MKSIEDIIFNDPANGLSESDKALFLELQKTLLDLPEEKFNGYRELSGTLLAHALNCRSLGMDEAEVDLELSRCLKMVILIVEDIAKKRALS